MKTVRAYPHTAPNTRLPGARAVPARSGKDKQMRREHWFGRFSSGRAASRDGPRSGAVRECAQPGRARQNPAGFTLIEIVIGAALTAMILVSAYMCLSSALASQKLIEPRTEILQSARVALAIMSADLRCACPLSKDSEFLGMHRMLGDIPADNLDFATHNYTPTRPNQGDFCEVSFFVDRDKESGQISLWRRRNPLIALDPLSGGSREEIAEGIQGLRFEYYDGYEWYDTWGEVKGHAKEQTSLRDAGNLSGMPEAVRITLWFAANPKPKSKSEAIAPAGDETAEPPLVFQTVARLNLALGDSSGGGSTTNAAAGPGNGGGNSSP